MAVCLLIDDSCSFRWANCPPQSWAIGIGCCSDGAATTTDVVADAVDFAASDDARRRVGC